jgi:hypothetical protein
MRDWSDLLDPYISFNASAREKLKMKEVSPEDILKASLENFEIPYPNIAAVEVGGFNKVTKGLPFFIFFEDDLNAPKYKFNVAMNDRYVNDFMQFLRTVLPGKV